MARLKEDVDNIWRTIAYGIMMFAEQFDLFHSRVHLDVYPELEAALVCLAVMPFIACSLSAWSGKWMLSMIKLAIKR